jgi:NAD-dependent SIR2 family protein deacetylase
MNSTCTAVRVAMGDRPHSPLQDVTAGVKEFCQALQSARHAIFVVGAGISTNCGIPDFRSPGSGVYDQVMDAGLCQGAVSSSTTPSLPFELLPDPESLFEIEYFRENPAPFYHFIRTIMPTEMELAPSVAHEMLKRLEVTKLTKRVFTQNIDGLELDAGLKRVSFCHGNLRHFICLKCRKKCDMGGKGDDTAATSATAGAAGVRAAIVQGSVPQCPKCDVGVLKPGIVFFGEKMPAGVGRLLADHLVSGVELCACLAIDLVGANMVPRTFFD